MTHIVRAKHWAGREGYARALEARWLKRPVRITKTDPEPFCDFRRLWHTDSYKFSAKQGWRHGVRSRSLGGHTSYLYQVRTWEI